MMKPPAAAMTLPPVLRQFAGGGGALQKILITVTEAPAQTRMTTPLRPAAEPQPGLLFSTLLAANTTQAAQAERRGLPLAGHPADDTVSRHAAFAGLAADTDDLVAGLSEVTGITDVSAAVAQFVELLRQFDSATGGDTTNTLAINLAGLDAEGLVRLDGAAADPASLMAALSGLAGVPDAASPDTLTATPRIASEPTMPGRTSAFLLSTALRTTEGAPAITADLPFAVSGPESRSVVKPVVSPAEPRSDARGLVTEAITSPLTSPPQVTAETTTPGATAPFHLPKAVRNGEAASATEGDLPSAVSAPESPSVQKPVLIPGEPSSDARRLVTETVIGTSTLTPPPQVATETTMPGGTAPFLSPEALRNSGAAPSSKGDLPPVVSVPESLAVQKQAVLPGAPRFYVRALVTEAISSFRAGAEREGTAHFATPNEAHPASESRPETIRPAESRPAFAFGFARNVVQQIRGASFIDGQTRIALAPRGLGEIEIDMRADEAGKLRIVLRAENSAVLQALRADREGLLVALSDGSTGAEDADLEFEDFNRRQPRDAESADASPDHTPDTARDDTALITAPSPRTPGTGTLDILT